MGRREFDPGGARDRALSALQALDPGISRDEWVRVGMAAKAAGLDFDDWHRWSATAGNYSGESDCRAVWRSFKPDGGIGAGTLFDAASKAGWRTEGGNNPRHTGGAQPPVRGGAVEDDAPALDWNSFAHAPADHPYLVRKEMPHHGLRIAQSNELSIAGQDCEGWLMLPVWNVASLKLQSLQAVSPAGGKKLSLPGHPIKGGALVFHEDAPDCRPDDAAFAAGEAYLCEGAATAASVHRATGRAAVCCFGKGNVADVAAALRKRFPGLRIVLCPDRGAEVQAGEIVRQIGAPAAVVALPEHLPQNADLNDYAATAGIEGVRELLSQAKELPQRYRLLSAGEIAAKPPAPWLVRDVLPPAGIGAIYGPSASGKSFLAQHLLAHIAEGRTGWFDHRIARPTNVVYVGLEGEAGLSGRVRAWQEQHGPIPAGFLFMTGQPFELLSDRDVTDLASAVRIAAGPGAVVCVDTLNSAAAGADENASEDMGRLIAAAKRLQAETDGLVLLVHHSGKDASKGMRGHSSFFAACDVVIEVTRTDDRRAWKLVKSKDGADGAEHPFLLKVVEIGTDPEDGQAITSCVVEPVAGDGAGMRRPKPPRGGHQKIVYDALGELLRQSKHFGMAGAPPTRPCVELEAVVTATCGRLTCDPKRQKERARSAITGLVNSGLIELRDGWLWHT